MDPPDYSSAMDPPDYSSALDPPDYLSAMDPPDEPSSDPDSPIFQAFPEYLYRHAEPDAAFPHIVDPIKFYKAMRSARKINLCVPDMIITILRCYKENLLEAFLDPKFEDIAFYHRESHPKKDFFIKKDGSTIKASGF